MKNFKLILLLAFIAQIFTSCNSSLLTVTKRHYSSGYYVDLNLGNKKKQATAEPKSIKNEDGVVAKIEPVKANEVAKSADYDKTLEASADKNLISASHTALVSSKVRKNLAAGNKSSKNILVKLGLSKAKTPVLADDKAGITNKTINNIKSEAPVSSGGKSQLVAALLCFFVGGIGIHRFYLGYTWQGIVQILTLGGLGIWTLIDFVRILMGTLEPKDGKYDKTL